MANYFFDFERSGPLHLELLESSHMEIHHLQPNLIFHFPQGELGGNLPLHFLLSSLVGSLSIIVSSREIGQPCFQVWEKGLAKRRVGTWFIAHHEQERSLLGDSMGGGVVGKLSHW